MNRIKQFLTAGVLSLILLCGTAFAATAENVSSSASDTSSASSAAGGSSSVSGETSGVSSASSSESSSNGEAVSSVESKTSSAVSSKVSSNAAPIITKNSSTAQTTSKSTNSIKSNVNAGNIDDGIDSSGWGSKEDESSSQLQSAGTQSNKVGSKKMFNLAKLLWILIWIPVLLIIASVAALIYVNRKGFLGESSGKRHSSGRPSGRGSSSKRTSARSSQHKNIYRPRD